MSTSGPVAVGPQGVDTVTYGPAYASAPVADGGGGGAISALRSAFAGASPGYGYAAPVVYAAAPGGPAGYDNSYHLGPGDKLRVVVYGQEGLTNSYAIDAAGAITMPLIGSVPARGRRWRSKSNPTGRSSSSARSKPPANIPTFRT